MSEMDTNGGMKALIEKITELEGVEVLGKGDAQFFSVPKGRTLTDLRKLTDEYLPAPRRKTGTSSHQTALSFVDVVNRFKLDQSAIYADRQRVSFEAVFDYHLGGDGSAQHRQHRAKYQCDVSHEWTEWKRGADSGFMTLEAFAEFLEERLVDVGDPGGAKDRAKEVQARLGNVAFASPNKLLELSRGLSVHVGQTVKNFRNNASGESTFTFSEGHTDEAGAPLTVPSMFLINIPVFDAGALYQIVVRLRYRVQGGKVTWAIQLHDAKVMIDHAFAETVDTIKEATEVPVFFGKPE